MNYIAFNTASEQLTVVVSVDGKTEALCDSENQKLCSEKLLPMVEGLLEKLNATLNQIDVFAVVVGPGSFTGIRIGVASVKGFIASNNKPFIAVTSFLPIAYAVSGKRLAVIDAKHGHYYVCGFDENNNECYSPSFIDTETLNELKNSYTLVAERKIEGFDCVIADLKKGLINSVEAKKDFADTNIKELKPFYLRLSQAEEGRK